ncbi:jg19498 [Pararge aegeria aegeria]|uniref:Jg19498 protein n=1 Tax=Pararge aegeria aegeria TaxID=348720 RepID=A0A8S4RE05_9NEOP|nr:jg19498 [Pararge aegeria aegeria]
MLAYNGKGKHREETCTPESSPKCSQRCVESTSPHWARVVDYDLNPFLLPLIDLRLTTIMPDVTEVVARLPRKLLFSLGLKHSSCMNQESPKPEERSKL